MTDKQNMQKRIIAGAGSRMAGRRMLLCGVSTLTLVVSGLCAPAAFADPAITYSGSLSPAPLAGTTNWTPDGDITMGLDGDATLTVSGGAAITAPDNDFNIGAKNADGHNSTFTIDGAGTKVDFKTFTMGQSNGSSDKLVVSGGASLTVSGTTNLARTLGVTNPVIASALFTGAGTTASLGGLTIGGANNSTGSVRIEEGAKVSVGVLTIGSPNKRSGESALRSNLTVTGVGSRLDVADRTNLGSPIWYPEWGQQISVLTIADGGTVSTNPANAVNWSIGSVLNIGAAPGQTASVAGTFEAVKITTLGAGSIGVPGATVNFNHTGETTFAPSMAAPGAPITVNQIAGTTKLTGDSDLSNVINYEPSAVNITGGTLQLGDGGTTGSVNIDITNNSTLAFNRSNAYNFDHVISGTGDVQQLGSGTLTLSGVNTYSGGTKINGGTIAVASDAALGDANGALTFNGGVLQTTAAFTSGRTFDFASNGIVKTDKTMTLNGAITGAGDLNKLGTGELVYNGDGSAHTGATHVLGGTLTLHGTLGGDVQVAGSGTLDGDGTINGDTHIVDGILSGVSGQTLDFKKDLVLDANSHTNVAMGADTDAMFNVAGNLTVAGKINITDDGGFGIGVNNIFHADGVVVNNGLTIGIVDPNAEAANITLDVLQHDVTLTNTGGLTLGYWDGANTAGDGTVHGGTGTWGAANNWTDKDGTNNGPWVATQFAIFGGTAGAVTVAAGGVSAAGMQFTTDGYTMSGGTLTLANGTAVPIIRVGDGSAGSDATKATISSVIAGTHGLNKTGKGTLVLTGANTYTGDTTISLGTLQLGAGGTIGTLASTEVHVDNNSTLAFNHSDTATFSAEITGAGLVTHTGSGTLTLSGNNSFTGGLTVSGGVVKAGYDINAFGVGDLTVTGSGVVDLTTHHILVARLAGDGIIHTRAKTLTVAPEENDIFAGKFDHDAGDATAALYKMGNGTLALTGENVGNVQVEVGTLQIGNRGATGSVAGDITVDTDAKLAFNRIDSLTYDHVVSGGGSLNQIGSGTTILTKANTYTGGTTISGGTLQLDNGGSITGDVSNDGTFAFNHSDNVGFGGVISGDGRVVQMGTGELDLSGANSFAGGLDVQKGIAKAGIADVAFGTGTLNVAKDGTADLNGFNTKVAGLSGEGLVKLTGGDLTLTMGDHFDGSLSGTGGLTLDGATQFLNGTSDYSGATNIQSGELHLGSNQALSAASAYTVADKGLLDLSGFSGSVASLTNAGMITNSGAAGARLNVNGDYTGQNGTLVLNTVLGDDNSTTDMLKVGGGTSGNTTLRVNNQNGAGAQTVNGIQVINIGGTSGGDFKLAGDYVTKDGQQAVVAGAYAYTLRKNSPAAPQDGNWYLTNNMGNNPVDPNNPDGPTNPVDPDHPVNPPVTRYSPGVPIYEGYVSSMQTLNKLSTLQQRVGERYLNGSNGQGAGATGAVVDEHGVWARVEGAHNRLEPSTSAARMKQDVNTFIMQSGVDGQFYEDENGRLIAGINGQYGHGRADVSSDSGDGTISTDAWSLGATATWYGNNGFYVDTQGQVTWFNSDLDSWTANTGLANGRKATGYAMSIEAGQRVDIDPNWSLTPQAQLMWSSINADAFNDVWGARVNTNDADSLTGRLGLAANYRNDWKGDDGLMVNTTVYGIANLYQEMLSGSSVNVSGVKFNTDNDRTWAGTGIGGSYAWADNKYAVYGEGSINTSLNHFAQSYAYKATVGFKAKW